MTPGKESLRTFASVATTILILVVVVLVYAPATAGGFLWDDKMCFHDSAALRVGDAWLHYLLRDFCDWTNYFRPLTVASFTAQVRMFGASPGPMHAASLAMHLVNSLLVGWLALRLGGASGATRNRAMAAAAMLLYALHPALVEPVAWVGCQADLLATFFILLGLIANCAASARRRAVLVAAAFFLAACSKESALSLPPLLLVVDLALARDGAAAGASARLRELVRRQRGVYASVFAAGLAYLAIRRWALGTIVNPAGETALFSFAHLQEISQVFVAYLRVVFLPVSGSNPIHPQAPGAFDDVTVSSVAAVAAVVAAWIIGALLVWRRRPLGILIAAVTAALLPVLHVIPVKFDGSLYHERYAINAIAIACALLPMVLGEVLAGPANRRRIAAVACGAWLLVSIANIRVTLPLWNNDLTLWQWAVMRNPQSMQAKDRLLTAYMQNNDRPRARKLVDAILASGEHCAPCLLNAANLALADGELERASSALQQLRGERQLVDDPEFLRVYLLATARLLELQGDLAAAEAAYREALRLDPSDPASKTSLAMLLVTKGDLDQARRVMADALARFAPDEREARSRAFEAAVARGGATAQH